MTKQKSASSGKKASSPAALPAFRRKARHKGASVAIFATARRLAQHIYRMLRFGQDYVDQGADAYERQFELRRLASLKETARSLGITLVEAPLPQGEVPP
jgi:hypothetical protein